MFLLRLERRFDPFFRPAFDAVLRDPLATLITALIIVRRADEGLGIAEEKPPTRWSGTARRVPTVRVQRISRCRNAPEYDAVCAEYRSS